MLEGSVRSFVVIAAVAVSAIAGCTATHPLDETVAGVRRDAREAVRSYTFSNDEPVELKTTGPLAFDVENFAGNVTIRADRKVTSTVIEARRGGSHGFGRREESDAALKEINWTATLEPREGGGDKLVVRSSTQSAEPHFLRLDLEILTPAIDTVKVRSTRGDVVVIENQGVVDIETTRGDVRMMTPWPMTGPITILTSDGSIDYRVRGESKGAFDCESHGGEVRQRCLFGKWLALDASNNQERLHAVLNGGTNPVVLRTSGKNIRVAVVADPIVVGTEIVDP
jgi:hypothetical protein